MDRPSASTMSRTADMVDKPPPYRRPMPPDYAPPPDVMVHDMQDAKGVIGGVLAAYRVNPILIAMILLLLTILGAVGWYATRNDDRIYGYIALRDKRENDLWDRLVEMARQCRDKEIDKSDSFPLPNFPNLSTGGPAFKPKENRR